MPSPTTSCLPRPAGLSLENTGLHGGREQTQTRRRLALTLPGSDWLNTTHLRHPPTESNRPQSLSLQPSWERGSSGLAVTSRPFVPSDLKLTSRSMLTSKLSLTSNPLLISELSLTSHPTLNSKLSQPTLTSDLSRPTLTSESMLTSCPTLTSNLSRPILTSEFSLTPKFAVTSHPSLTSDPAVNSISSVTSKLAVPSQLTLTSNPALTPNLTFSPSATINTSFDPNKCVTLQTTFHPCVTLNLESSVGDSQEEPRDLGSQEDMTSQESLMSPSTSLEEESPLHGGMTSPLASEEISELWLSPPPPPLIKSPHTEDKLQPPKQETETQLCQKKMALVSAVCCSLVNGPKFSDPSDLTRAEIRSLCEELAGLEPEFVLKVALYTRQELNIRSTANFLLALSALLPPCRPHLRRYFCAAVQLPSDWMEVPRLYESLAGRGEKLAPLPCCLRRALALKFREFSEYQLAKYNTRRQRGKHGSGPRRVRKPGVPRNVKISKHLKEVAPFIQALQKQFDAPPATPPSKKTKDSFSLKSLIQRLHISKPANHVMSLLGCRYPPDLSSFSRSGLEGPWQSHLSGKRMKLKQPETWERELSRRGNTAPVWEGLLDSHQVPFMALLRNLRSVIRAGVSDRHHGEVTARLSNQNAVIKSRLFPFRFLSAYKVILDLESQSLRSDKPFPTNSTLLQRILKREGKAIPELGYHRWNRHKLRACLAVPVLFQLLKIEKEALRKARAVLLDIGVLQKYKRALEEAVRIAARHNIPPLPGRTVILCCVGASMSQPCHGAKDLTVEPGDSQRVGKKTPPTLLEVGLLLSLMVRDTAESTQLVLYDENSAFPAETSSDSLLHNVSDLKQRAQEASDSSSLPLQERSSTGEFLLELLARRTKVDTLLVFGPCPPDAEFKSALQHYRREVNAGCLCVSVLPAGFTGDDGDGAVHCNDVTLCGFTEQVLRYVSERGTARLLDHVGKVNERFEVPEDPESVRRSHVTMKEGIPLTPRQRWRSIRVFISSTFRDMHAERDLLIGRVMPELRARAACHFLSLEEVDLRWGITEEEAKGDRQLSLCLSEVSRCQIFIGILGERYGHIPGTYSVPLLPEYKWIEMYPPGRSITELEAMQFLQSCDPGNTNGFFYLREPEFLRSVPSNWLSDFASESRDAEIRVADLKSRLTQHPAARSYRYSCQWGGELHGKPLVTGLEDFGARVLEDIWQVIERDFIKRGPEASNEDEEQLAQEGFQEWQERQSCARHKLVSSTCAQILERTRGTPGKGRVFLVCGEPSQGKTVFMAALVKELNLAAASSVIYHFCGATPGAQEAENMLTRVCKHLSLRLQSETSDLTSYRVLLAEFQSLLLLTSRSLRRSDTLTLLIDGADLLCGHAGKLTSDWLPEHLPQRVNLVLSVTEGSSLCCSLRRRKDAVLVPLGGLEPSDRAELVRQRLAIHGKKLDETAFNNQMRLLLIKKGCRDPLYLTLVCEELRANAIYEKLSDDIQQLPATLPPLIQRMLGSLEQEHGVTMVTMTLTAICVSRKGLRERDLLRILSLLQRVSCVYSAGWDQLLTAAARTESLPMATFSLLLRGLRSVLGLWTPTLTSDPRLHLPSGLLRDAVDKRYFGRPEVPIAAHRLMAAHFWTVTVPEDPDSVPVLDSESLSELSHHLLCSEQLHRLGKLLAHLPFLRAHASLGLLPYLCQIYSRHSAVLFEEEKSLPDPSACPLVRDTQAPDPSAFREFIHRSLPVLSQNPSLFYQQALNEPDGSPVCTQAQEIVGNGKGTGAMRTIVWNNKPATASASSSKSLEYLSVPGCVSLCPGGRLAAVGTSDGSLHLLNTDSGEEVRTLHSGCDGVSACAFISDHLLCVTSYDGMLEMWNIPDGCRMHRSQAHRRQVTGCCVSADRRQLLTCSLDSQLKLWDTSRGSVLGTNSFPSPLNCATFHPRGHVIAVGSWDGRITVLRLDNWKRSAVLCGGSSVRAVSFSPGGSTVVSGSLDGWVTLWGWEMQVQLSRFRAHSGSALTTSFLRHGENLLTGGEDGKVQIWSGGLGRLNRRVCAETACSPALSLAVSPNGHRLAVGYHSDPVCVYSTSTGALVAECNLADVAVISVAWLSEEVLVTGSSDNLVRIWEVSSGQTRCRLSLNAHQRSVQALAVSSQLLASASEDVSVCLWSLCELLSAVSPPSPVSVLRGHTAAVTCCSFSLDGRLLATGGQDRSVLCWDVSSNPATLAHSLLSCHRDWVTGCAWTDAALLVSCSGDGSVCLWDIQREERLLEFVGHQGAVSSALCMGERVLTVSRSGCLKVWSLAGLEIASIPAHSGPLNQCAAYWEPRDSRGDDDLVVFTAGADGSVLKWSPLQMDQVQTLLGHGAAVTSSAAADPGCEVLVTAAQDGSVNLWGAPRRDGRLAETRHAGAVTAVTWSPDTELVVSGGETGDVIVWKWKQRVAVLTLQCSELCVCSLLFTSPRTFCAVTNDTKVSRWVLLPCKGGDVRAKKAFTLEVGSLVVRAALAPSQSQLQLHTVYGEDFLLEPKTGSLQRPSLPADRATEPALLPPRELLHSDSIITASQPGFGASDSSGGLWLQTSDVGGSKGIKTVKWERKQIHSASISSLHVTDDLIITSSADQTVKVWECSPFRQVGLFRCEGAVTCLSPSPSPKLQSDPAQGVRRLACGDQYGNVYLLTCL